MTSKSLQTKNKVPDPTKQIQILQDRLNKLSRQASLALEQELELLRLISTRSKQVPCELYSEFVEHLFDKSKEATDVKMDVDKEETLVEKSKSSHTPLSLTEESRSIEAETSERGNEGARDHTLGANPDDSGSHEQVDATVNSKEAKGQKGSEIEDETRDRRKYHHNRRKAAHQKEENLRSMLQGMMRGRTQSAHVAYARMSSCASANSKLELLSTASS